MNIFSTDLPTTTLSVQLQAYCDHLFAAGGADLHGFSFDVRFDDTVAADYANQLADLLSDAYAHEGFAFSASEWQQGDTFIIRLTATRRHRCSGNHGIYRVE